MDPRVLAIRDEANKILGERCIKQCGAFCCKNYSLILTEKEMKTVVGEKEKELRANGKLKQRMGGGYLLNIDGGCPALDKNNRCTVYKNRPSVCRNAPFVFDDDYKIVKVGCECGIAESDILVPFFEQFEKIGWKVFIATDEELGTKLTRWKGV
ncbi:MAG: YkgJ family cysteine cluster protein [Candidatus Woesearchaeota archaeon]|nr:YkgJ family cysteine cluster protein [Candidatus Woesearchaeota archaeon]